MAARPWNAGRVPWRRNSSLRIVFAAWASATDQPNPPLWPSSVVLITPDDEGISERVASITSRLTDRHTGHFSSERYAVLFAPGLYEDVSIDVGYYVQVLGLGEDADDVVFSASETARAGGVPARGIYCEAMDKREGGAGSLDTFWRAAEVRRGRGGKRLCHRPYPSPSPPSPTHTP